MSSKKLYFSLLLFSILIEWDKIVRISFNYFILWQAIFVIRWHRFFLQLQSPISFLFKVNAFFFYFNKYRNCACIFHTITIECKEFDLIRFDSIRLDWIWCTTTCCLNQTVTKTFNFPSILLFILYKSFRLINTLTFTDSHSKIWAWAELLFMLSPLQFSFSFKTIRCFNSMLEFFTNKYDSWKVLNNLCL